MYAPGREQTRVARVGLCPLCPHYTFSPGAETYYLEFHQGQKNTILIFFKGIFWEEYAPPCFALSGAYSQDAPTLDTPLFTMSLTQFTIFSIIIENLLNHLGFRGSKCGGGGGGKKDHKICIFWPQAHRHTNTFSKS